jgi:hypothetical protein
MMMVKIEKSNSLTFCHPTFSVVGVMSPSLSAMEHLADDMNFGPFGNKLLIIKKIRFAGIFGFSYFQGL